MLDFSNYPTIPGRTQVALVDYIERGILPGGFLCAVLANDLYTAIGQADSENLVALPKIVEFLWNDVSAAAIGNYENVRNWSKSKMYKSE